MKRQKQFEFNFTEKITQHHQPLRMSPSFRIKFYSPIKVQKIKLNYQKDIKVYQSHCFGQFIDTYHIPTIHTQRAASQKKAYMYSRQQTPNYSQINQKDSDIENNKFLESSRIIRLKKQIRIIDNMQ
ncbi:unnamed protein product [Paramecium pentaurelia]|uniref:Uncharacterized protein n=1 Tax=Paramecium pentaurelia TaxID=43138 RepID=A0A8S1UY10_9CILI|nr:unnamed protein product [Paramecium pentaurelia]